MQITTSTAGSLLEITVRGRLDNDSASDLNAAVDEILRKGQHAAVIDLREVDYMSSAGLGALIRAHKRFRAVQGMFGVKAAASHVEEVIRLSGVAKLLMCDPEELARWSGGARATTVMPSFMVAADSGLQLELYDFQSDARMECRVWGDPARLTGGVNGRHCPAVPFAGNTMGLGLGALGHDFADCAGRFGEFLAVAGGVAVQPTPAGGKPDYQVATGDFVPKPHVLYGLSCSGEFARMIRFTPNPSIPNVCFSALVEQCLKQSKTKTAAMVFIAEAAGLVGATLRRSPVADAKARTTFAHPEIRNWLSFAPEHVHQHTLALIVGVASQGSPTDGTSALVPLLRPLAKDGQVYGHFHAAVFSYRPLKKRKLDLQETVATLFDSEDLHAVLHLLNDDRAISGGGESELVSGACWVGPLGNVTAVEGA